MYLSRRCTHTVFVPGKLPKRLSVHRVSTHFGVPVHEGQRVIGGVLGKRVVKNTGKFFIEMGLLHKRL